MSSPITIDFEQLNWQPHPTIPGINIKLHQTPANFSPADVLIARVETNGVIPWHVHPAQSEIAYVLQGTGLLLCAADESHESVSENAMSVGGAVIIPPGLWHCVQNVGAGDLLIFAAHTTSAPLSET